MTLRLRARVNFPASVRGIGGIGVAKSNGEWIIQPQFSDLPVLLPQNVTDPASKQVWIYDPALNTYAVLTLLGLSQALTTLTSTTSTLIGLGSKSFTTQTNKDISVGQYVVISSDANPANYMYGPVTAYVGALLTVNVLATGGVGTFADWTIRLSGQIGPQGIQGFDAGFKYSFNTATAGDPGSGKWLVNNAAFMSATQLNISETDGDGNALAAFLATLDDSTNPTNKCLVVFRKENGTPVALGFITGTLTDLGTYNTFPFTPVAAIGALANNDVTRLNASIVGNKGTDGSLAASGTPTVGQFGVWVTATTLKGVSITGLVKGNGVADPAAATAGTDYMHPGTTSAITVGFTVTPNNIGNMPNPHTPNPALGNYQFGSNNGAFTWNAPGSDCAIDYLITNTASAGAITFSGYTVASGNAGDALTTTNGHRFIISIRRINAISTYLIKALQ